ncbi:MAG: cellulase family glycosylhydrolase [Bacilli bacterium]|nr:cellulase family glycosylhydrolase [Bacilli bacterium]
MQKYKKQIYYLSLFFTLIYILFRVFFTLPYGINLSLFFSIFVLLIEVIDFIFFAFYVLNILVKDYSIPKAPKLLKKDYPELDVFIATINEDVSLIEETIKKCKEMKYPNKNKIHIYLCDDGRRKEMKDLCKKMNIHYIDRKDNRNAKAGNYNHALTKTKSPYIVVFDADMKPSKDFLMKAVPYLFFDEKIGFVQLPQSFDHPDIFQKRFKIYQNIPLEQDYFYHRIQVSRNHNNSVIFCGTNAVFSRKALESIGGFATKTITEDFATGLLLERKGYKGVALPFDEVYGLNVSNIMSFIKQRTRWCRGCIQTYKNYKILFHSGLNKVQKMDYLSGIYYWFYGFRNIIYLLVPLLFAFFDIRIIQGNILLFIILFLTQYILKRFIIDLLENRKVSSTWNRIYEVILSPIIFIESLLELLGFSKKKFEVTKKNNQRDKNTFQLYYLIISHCLFFIVNLLGLSISLRKGYLYGYIEFIIPIFWLSTNCIYLFFALIFDFSNQEIPYKSDRISSKYFPISVFILLKEFAVTELKIKRIAISFGILIIFVLGICFNHYYQYQKSIIIKNSSLVSYNKWLSIKDGNIVNKKNEIVQLKGVSTHNLYWYSRVYTKDNIKEIRDTWGVNVFRIAVYTNPEEDGYIINKNQIEKVKEIINYCIDLDLYVIVDWHILKDNNPNIYKKESIEFFEELSKEYSDVPNVIYEICNEPNGEDVTWNEDIKPYAEELIQVIRNNSKKSLIIVGLADWCKDIESARMNMLEDKNTLYAVHFYAGDQQSQILKTEISNAKTEKIPIVVTECGATNETGDGNLYKKEFDTLIHFFESNHIGWIVWQLSEKDETSSLLIKKEVQDRLDFLYEKYTEKQLKRKKYHINDYLSDTGSYMKEIFKKYN